MASALAAPVAPKAAAPAPPKNLTQNLEGVRARVVEVERGLIDSLKARNQAKTQLKTLQTLLKLRQKEREMSRRRMAELESTVRELESRRGILRKSIVERRRAIRETLGLLARAQAETPSARSLRGGEYLEQEKLESARRRVLANLTGRSLHEIEAMKADLSDADQVEGRIAEERQQLTYAMEELDEKEGILELSRQLQNDLIEEKHRERVEQLESYRRLKSTEAQMEQLIQSFNARVELQRATDAERDVARSLGNSEFARSRGHLPSPLEGARLIAKFGKAIDPTSRLHVFRKGIELQPAAPASFVKAVGPGKVVHAGELAGYGLVAIVDHGDHFYSLYAKLGVLQRKSGDALAAGDVIGKTDDSGAPVYFEIRARNVAVNPLQWFSNSFSLN